MGFYNTINTQEIASRHRLRYLTWVVPDLLSKIRGLENPGANFSTPFPLATGGVWSSTRRSERIHAPFRSGCVCFWYLPLSLLGCPIYKVITSYEPFTKFLEHASGFGTRVGFLRWVCVFFGGFGRWVVLNVFPSTVY